MRESLVRTHRRLRSVAVASVGLALILLPALTACGDDGSPTSASPSATASSAPKVASTWPAGASPEPAVSYSPSQPGGGMRGAGAFTLGWRFTPALDIEVTSLGYVDPAKDGLVHAHRVGIFDVETEELVVSAVVGPMSALDGYFRWEQLEAPVALRAGHPYVVGAVFKGGDEVKDGEAVWATEVGHTDTGHGTTNYLVSAPKYGKFAAPYLEAGYAGFIVPNFTFRPVSADSPSP